MNKSRHGTWLPFRSAAQVPAEPEAAKIFDHLQSPDIRTAPHRPIAPFGARERTVGDPEALFADNVKSPKVICGRTAPIGRWFGILQSLKPFGAKGQVAGVNNYINRAACVSEIADYGKSKPWTIPVTHFRCGDHSENHALAKYISLRFLGFHPERLRLVWLKHRSGGDHAVLTVSLGGQAFVLDSRHDVILPAEKTRDAIPYCSLNGFRFCVHWQKNARNGAERALRFMARRVRRGRLLEA